MIKLGMDEIRYLNALSKLSGVNAKDCIIGEKNITFIVPEKDMGQAIGKNGSTIEEIRKRIRGLIARLPRYQPTESDYVKTLIRDQIGQFLYNKTKRRPMILPVVIEI